MNEIEAIINVCGSESNIKRNLAQKYYIDANIFEQEKEHIFFKNWLIAGHQSQIPNIGDYYTTKILGQGLIFMRGRDGQVRGFYNVCPHRGHELILDDKGNKNHIQCRYHAWVFKTDGELKTARGLENLEKFNKEDLCINQFKVEVFCGFIFMNFDEEARPMNEIYPGVEEGLRALAPDIDDCVLSFQHSEVIKTNWKLVAENYCECFHCPSAHPLSSGADIVNFKTMFTHPKENYVLHSACSHPEGKQSYALNHSIERETRYAAYYVWPLSGLQIYPGSLVNTYHWVPIDANQLIVYRTWYFKNSEPTEEQMKLIQTDLQTTYTEDVQLLESVQRGMQNRGYKPGPIVIKKDGVGTMNSENGVFAIQRMVLDALG